MSFAYDNAANIVNDAATECGLAATTDVFASTDQNFVRLRGLLKSTGRTLVKRREWSHLQSEYVFTTVTNQGAYPLPPDFRKMISQTHWNRTSRFPLGGPVSPSEWQYAQAQNLGTPISLLFRPKQGQLVLYPDTTTPGGQTLAFEYLSFYWVQPVGQAGPTTDAPTLNTDIVCLDSLMVMKELKRAFLASTGFDSQNAQQEATDAYNLAANEDAPDRVVDLATKRASSLLSEANIPPTNWGR